MRLLWPEESFSLSYLIAVFCYRQPFELFYPSATVHQANATSDLTMECVKGCLDRSRLNITSITSFPSFCAMFVRNSERVQSICYAYVVTPPRILVEKHPEDPPTVDVFTYLTETDDQDTFSVAVCICIIVQLLVGIS